MGQYIRKVMDKTTEILKKNKSHFTSEDFKTFWGDGYIENFGGSPEGTSRKVFETCIEPFASKDKTVLEIGCGGGFWINTFLKESFGKVIAIDVIPQSKNIQIEEYHQLPECDYECSPIASNSIDFVWCYGVFCHLPNEAVRKYLKNTLRVLKNGGDAVIMFPNWDKHPAMKDIPNRYDYCNKLNDMGWFCMDNAIIQDTINSVSGTLLEYYTDIFPDHRDTLIHFKK